MSRRSGINLCDAEVFDVFETLGRHDVQELRKLIFLAPNEHDSVPHQLVADVYFLQVLQSVSRPVQVDVQRLQVFCIVFKIG